MFRFSIREMLLVTVIVAILMAWWFDSARLRDEVRRISVEKAAAKEALAETQVALVKSMAWVGPVPKSQVPSPNLDYLYLHWDHLFPSRQGVNGGDPNSSVP